MTPLPLQHSEPIGTYVQAFRKLVRTSCTTPSHDAPLPAHEALHPLVSSAPGQCPKPLHPGPFAPESNDMGYSFADQAKAPPAAQRGGPMNKQTENIYRAYRATLVRELVCALGCTEPIAVAYASALARKTLGCEPEHLRAGCSGNIIKNVKSVTVPNSDGMHGIEAAARKLRYEILEREDADHILTAHHLDDQAETILMRILSLSPLYRFEGIRRERGRIFRPFLSIEKELINAYVAEENLLYSTDTTNSDVRYMRNYIRTFLLPHMSIENKRLLSSIALNMQVINKRSLPVRMKKGFSFMMGRSDFLSSTPLRKEEVFYEVNRAFGFSSLFPRSECLEAERAIREKRSFVCSRFYLRTENDEVRFFPPHVNIVLDASKSFTWNNLSYLVDDPECDDKTLRIDFSAISFPLILRESREGDSIELKEGRKKIKDLEKEYRVPYCFILEDRISIVAVFCRLFGKRDRIAKRLLGLSGKACSLKETKTD